MRELAGAKYDIISGNGQTHFIACGDALEELKRLPDDNFDLVFTSPPYEAKRDYGIGFNKRGQEWVDWCVPIYQECVRVSRGLVAWVVGHGSTSRFKWSATPSLLEADLHRSGVMLRNPPAMHRVGIPGSGGPDWLRADYERIVCASKGRLPWSDNTAMGGEPRYAPGGSLSHQTKDGRVRGRQVRIRRTNPGNVIKVKVGGGHMGHPSAHLNEAPFSEVIAEFFIRSFCPPGGTVFDPFVGSGTTCAVAAKNGRSSVGFDLREDQCSLALARVQDVVSQSLA